MENGDVLNMKRTAGKTGETEVKSKTLFLSEEERLKLQNLNLRRNMLQLQVQQETAKIDQEELQAVERINARIGVDLTRCRLNFDNGEVTVLSEEELAKVRPQAILS
jgi:hypothetical protein